MGNEPHFCDLSPWDLVKVKGLILDKCLGLTGLGTNNIAHEDVGSDSYWVIKFGYGPKN